MPTTSATAQVIDRLNNRYELGLTADNSRTGVGSLIVQYAILLGDTYREIERGSITLANKLNQVTGATRSALVSYQSPRHVVNGLGELQQHGPQFDALCARADQLQEVLDLAISQYREDAEAQV